jgi:hypothetical protein
LFSKFIEAMISRRRREGFRLAVPADLIQGALAKLGVEILDRRGERPTLGDVRQWHIPSGSYDLDTELGEAKRNRFLSSDGNQNAPVEFIHPLFIEYFAAVHLNAILNGSPPDYGSALNKRIGHPRWREAIIMLTSISRSPAGLLTWIATRLKIEAMYGSLFGRPDLPPWTLFLGWYQTKVDLLLRCWEGSSLSSDRHARGEIVEALQVVVRLSAMRVQSHTRSLWFETASALRALTKIGDDHVLSDIDNLINQEPRRTTKFSLLDLSSWFNPNVFELARNAAHEIRQRSPK